MSPIRLLTVALLLLLVLATPTLRAEDQDPAAPETEEERAKRLKPKDVAFLDGAVDVPKPSRAPRVAVIGSGVMGAGIAQWVSARGGRVKP